MANVKISNLPVENTLANMTGIAGYNAAGTAQISGADIISGAAQPVPNLASVLGTGSIATSGQTITLGNTGPGGPYTATMGAAGIAINNSGPFDISSNGEIKMSYTGGGGGDQIIISTIGGLGTGAGILIDSGGSVGTGLRLKSATEINVVGTGLGTPAVGDVLAAKNVSGDLEWVTAGGTTPGIVDVLNAGYTGNSGQQINLTTGGTVTQYSQPSIISGGAFSITQGNNSLLTLGNGGSPTTILGGSGAIQVGDTGGNLLISTNGSDKLQLSVNATGEVQFYLGSNNPGPAIGDVLTAKTTSGDVHWTTPATPENSLTISNTVDTDMFDDGVVRLWWDVSASDIELEITNQGGGSGSTSSVYHASYTNFDGSSTSTTTTDFNAQNATTTGTLDFNFATDEVMILRLWTPDTSLQPGFGYYEVTFTKSSSLYTGTPILCSVRKSSL